MPFHLGMLLSPPRSKKIAKYCIICLAVTVVCIVVSISLIPVPETIGTTSLIDFYESGCWYVQIHCF